MKAKLDLSGIKIGGFYKTRSKSFIVVDKSEVNLPRRPHLGELSSRPVQTITVFYVSHRRTFLHQKLKTYSMEHFMKYLGATSELTFS